MPHRSVLSLPAIAILLLSAGCPQSPPATNSDPVAPPADSATAPVEAAQPLPSENPADTTALEEAGAKLKRDGDGLVIEVDFRGTMVDSGLIEHAALLPRLRSLILIESGVTDEQLKVVGHISGLQNLDLRDCAISNAGLAHLTGLEKLRALRLSGKSGATTVDDAGMESVAKLTNLRALLLDYLWISEVGLAELAPLKDLSELYLSQTLVGDEALDVLKQFPKLSKLRLSRTQVTSQGLEKLVPLSGLTEVDLSECSQIFDDGMTHLGQVTSLKRLNLWRVALTDYGVEQLAPLVNLEWLNLDNTQLSDAGLDALKNMDKLTFLHLGSTAISDAGLPKLAHLKSLRDLKVTRTAVTEEGVMKLKEQLPETDIQLKYLGGEE